MAVETPSKPKSRRQERKPVREAVTSKVDDSGFVELPELEVRINETWINFISYVAVKIPFGVLKLRIANGQPNLKYHKEHLHIRFDRSNKPTKAGWLEIIGMEGAYIHQHWINMIQWIQTHFVSGDLEIKFVNGLPTNLEHVKQKVYFNKAETIPKGMPLDF